MIPDRMVKIVLSLFFFWNLTAVGWAQTQEKAVPVQGFVDTNHDGINDWFRDANGDGINDVNQKPYPHLFPFVDKNQDGINDYYRDADGDGVNDLLRYVKSRYPEMRGKNVIDVDGDWINDITGMIYDRRDLRGYRFGKVLEEFGQEVERFVDEDGDGQYDGMWGRWRGNRRMDRFIDRDRDGVCDGRGFYRHRRCGEGNRNERP